MRHVIAMISALGILAIPARGQIAFTGGYTNNFDAMGSAGTAYDPGWAGVRWSGSGPAGEALTLGVTTGSTTSGGMFNVGSSADPDRALGSLASSSTVPRFGAQFQNDTGAAITDLTLTGVMEQWRTGNNATVDEAVAFEYSLDATGIDDAAATWVAVPAMNLNEKLTASTSAGALPGNLEENRTEFGTVLNGIDWAPGTALTLRWSDADVAGSDGLLALDNFGMTTVPEPSTWALLVLGAAGLGGWRRMRA
jgi:trimeric autotransporter adhesin